MKYTLLTALILVSGILFPSCSQAPAPRPDSGTLHIVTAVQDGLSVSGSAGNGSPPQGNTVDSIRISRLRFLMQEIAVYTADSSRQTLLRKDAIVYLFDSSGAYFITTGLLDTGNYGRIKLEIARFSAGTADFYRDDPRFKDFLTNAARPFTAIIEGRSYRNGTVQNFVYKSDPVANISLGIEPLVHLRKDSVNLVRLAFLPASVFRSSSGTLDPGDEKNAAAIDNAIRSAFLALPETQQ